MNLRILNPRFTKRLSAKVPSVAQGNVAQGNVGSSIRRLSATQLHLEWTTRHSLLLLAVVILSQRVSPSVLGQTVVPVPTIQRVAPVYAAEVEGAGGVVVQPVPADQTAAVAEGTATEVTAEQTAEAIEQQRKQERTKRISALKFDRRPSAILKAWSSPFKTLAEIEEERKAKAAKENPTAALEEEQADEGATDEATEPTEAEKAAAELQVELKEFDEALHRLKYHVTTGQWEQVEAFIADLDEKESQAVYQQLVTSLQQGPAANVPRAGNNRRVDPRLIEKNTFTNQDVVAIMSATPTKHTKQTLQAIGGILSFALQAGNDIQDFLKRFNQVVGPEDDASRLITKRQAARVLFGAGQATLAGEYLPTLDEATEDGDREALNLLAQYFLAIHAKDRKLEDLENAWKATQAALASGDADQEEVDVALQRAVELAPRVREELGNAWLEESFTSRPDRGREILASIGTLAASNPQNMPGDADRRAKGLELQSTVAESLLKVAPERATEWRESLNLLALNWLKEAEFSFANAQSTSSGPMMRRDPYGNVYYFNEEELFQQRNNGNRSVPIAVAKILETKPSDEWQEHLDESYGPRFTTVFARLYLKVEEEEEAFPLIAKLAKTHREEARELAHEFLRVWTKNHNPNSNRYRSSSYLYYYGYESRAERIPLTRSKQQRNLVELAKFVEKLKGLDLGELDEDLLANAFTSTHSQAEVYRLDSIESVFGSIDSLEPDTLAELVQRMRANLATVWRAPAIQERNKTNRKQKDIQAEVLRGYDVTRSVIEKAQKEYPDAWSLQLARAAITHDENDYQASLTKSSEFSQTRQQSFDDFHKAAELYAAEVVDLPEDEWTTRVYELWFYAALGACDLAQINNEKVGDLRQYPLIREAMESLPPEAAKWHMDSFATQLFTRMSGAKPAIKVRYLKAGFEIVGDNDKAAEARKVFDYYNDLVTEIQLVTRIDGSDIVGHGQPFGLFVDLRHTKEIEREAGGFAKYLQNQNSGTRYYYNYGRPLEDYRDKFQEAATSALNEHFEVLSVTFQHEDVNSKATNEAGWRVTPYAYILLKSRGPEVDRIPPLSMNFDFLDTSGYAIIPVESDALPIDSRPENGELRPIENVIVTQTLDDRSDGNLVVEIKATARGLVPDLDQVIDLKPDDFEIVEINDQGVSVSEFDEESDDTVINSERVWDIKLKGREDLADLPTVFTFGSTPLPEAQMVYQRYVDADLEEVESTVSLERTYGETSKLWIVWTALGVLVGGVAIALMIATLRKQPEASETPRFVMPDPVTPFTVIGLLKDIQANNGLSGQRKDELRGSISRLEEHYFAESNGEVPDLHAEAKKWLQQTS